MSVSLLQGIKYKNFTYSIFGSNSLCKELYLEGKKKRARLTIGWKKQMSRLISSWKLDMEKFIE